MKTKNFLKFFTLAAVLLVFACAKDEFVAVDGVCPLILTTTPIDGAVDVPLDQVISVTFNKAMNHSTINANSFTVSDGSPLVGTMTFEDTEIGTTVFFTPTTNLNLDTTYTGKVFTTVKDTNGNALQVAYVWSFSTGSVLAPVVLSTDPDSGAINVVLNKVIKVTFSQVIDPLTITSESFTLRNGTSLIAGDFTFDGAIVYFTPLAELSSSTTYTATITTAVTNLEGVALANNYVWNFSTGSLLAPTVISTDPIDDATDVVLNKVISATFSEVMDPATITSNSFKVLDGTTAISGNFTFVNAIVRFTPTNPLTPNTTYIATITTAVANPAGVSLAGDYIWNFSTGSTVAPTVIETDPVDEAIDVPLNQIITATFSEIMDPATITSTSFLVNNGSSNINGTFTFNGAEVLFTPSNPLTLNTIYTATITTAVKNPAGVSIANDYIWKFSTGVSLAPTVISTDPEDNETNVPLNKVIIATFSEIMNPATINATTFSLMNGTTNVSVTFGFNGVDVSFTPVSPLLAGITYTATITTGAQNMDGIGLEVDYVWEFTTANSSTLPDTGTISEFGGFGGNAGLTNQGINTVINNGGIGTTAASTLVTGFHDGLTGDIYTETPLNVGLVTGGIYTAPPPPGTETSFAIAQQALLDAQELYTAISPAAMPGGTDPGAGELGGLTLAPGVYQSASGTFNISNGDLTLDAQGDPNALWVFQSAAGLTVGIAGPTGAKSVILINGANSANVFWQVGSAATINGAGGGIMVGTIVSMAGVTLSTADNMVQTVLNGRAISLVASVTMVNTTINVPN